MPPQRLPRAPSRFLPARARRASCRTSRPSTRRCSKRTVAFYLCSPSNPQGAVAGRAYLARAIALARRFDFLLFADECYSEIYGDAPPPGALETAHGETGNLRQCRGVPVALQALRAAGPQVRLRRRRSRIHRGLRPLPQRRLPASAASRAACLGRPLGETRRMSSRAGRSTARISTSPTQSWRAAMATGGPPGASFFGSNMAGFRGRGGGRENPLERVWCQSAAGSLSRTSRARWRQSGQGLRQGRARA